MLEWNTLFCSAVNELLVHETLKVYGGGPVGKKSGNFRSAPCFTGYDGVEMILCKFSQQENPFLLFCYIKKKK